MKPSRKARTMDRGANPLLVNPLRKRACGKAEGSAKRLLKIQRGLKTGRAIRAVSARAHERSQKRAASSKASILKAPFACLLICFFLLPSNGIAEKQKSAAQACLMFETRESETIDQQILIGDGLSVRLERYEIGDTFRYSPSGGFSMISLSAKEGYYLLCLYLSVESETGDSISTAILQGMELSSDDIAAVTARGSFFKTRQEMSLDGSSRKSHVVMEGYLLFALPDDIIADKELTAVLYYEENEYSCRLSPEVEEDKAP